MILHKKVVEYISRNIALYPFLMLLLAGSKQQCLPASVRVW